MVKTRDTPRKSASEPSLQSCKEVLIIAKHIGCLKYSLDEKTFIEWTEVHHSPFVFNTWVFPGTSSLLKWKSFSHVQLFVTPWTIQSMEFSRPEYWSGYLSLLQGIFPTQGLNLGLPDCGWILYELSHNGSPRTLEWVAYPFSSGSSQPRTRTEVSCIAGGFFTNWAMREAFR